MSDSRNESAPVARLGLAAIGRRLPGRIRCPPGWPSRDEIIAYLDDLLEIDAFTDYGPNGLQVPGAAEVSRVVTGVSAQRELFERAAADGAQLVLCHHGLFWDFHPRVDRAGA